MRFMRWGSLIRALIGSRDFFLAQRDLGGVSLMSWGSLIGSLTNSRVIELNENLEEEGCGP